MTGNKKKRRKKGKEGDVSQGKKFEKSQNAAERPAICLRRSAPSNRVEAGTKNTGAKDEKSKREKCWNRASVKP